MSAKMSLLPAARAGIARIGASGSPAEPPVNPTAEPEVYCRQLGQEHAARGLAPCSDLGCQGCTPRHRAK